MATEEITISELELADEVLADMALPVDTATETRAVTLKQLRAWLGSALPIGSIFASVGKLDDARFTLLDGKTISRTGTYEAFCNKVVSNVQAGKWTACTEEEFNLEVSETGQCGKFVVSNDYVRIPKLGNSLCSGVIDGTIAVVGNGKALGITNGTTVGDLINGGGDAYNRVGLHLSSKLTNATLPQSNANIKSDYSGLSIGVVQDEQTSGLIGKINSVQVYYYMVVSTEGQTAEIEVDVNKVYEDLNIKANTSLSNVDANIDYVVESYRSGANWYRVYKSGWIEQGGQSNGNSTWSTKTISLLKPFNNTNYNVSLSKVTTVSTSDAAGCSIRALDQSVAFYNRTTSSFSIGGYYNIIWQASGQGA